MNILFLTIGYPESSSENNLFSDLVEELSNKGNNIIVFKANEKKLFGKYKEISNKNNIKVINIPTGKLTKVNNIIKVINILLLELRFKLVIKNYLDLGVDILMYSTPPITFSNIIYSIKKSTNCITYLLLKDIFPQNAVDLGIIRKGGLIYEYFRKKEKYLYSISDQIGCMSSGNMNYLIKMNPEINKEKIHINPNSIKIRNIIYDNTININNKEYILKKYGIPLEKIKLCYGGSLGEPQGIDFILSVCRLIDEMENVFFIIIGSGTKFENISNYIKKYSIKNVMLIKYLEKKDYLELLQNCDIGAIFLDKRFTIPNIPSRMLDYLEYNKPILAATDNVTDLKDIIVNNKIGEWCESENIFEYKSCLENIICNIDTYKNSKVCYSVLEKYFLVKNSAEIIISKFKCLKGANLSEI